MAIKKTNIDLTYQALVFKVFMDGGDITYYNKQIYITSGMAGQPARICQMLGNIGACARMKDFDNDIDIIVFSDYMMKRYNEGYRDEFIMTLEELINRNNTPYRKLKFTTEERLLDFLTQRATTSVRYNTIDLKAKDNSEDLVANIEKSIERDELMIDMIKTYKKEAKKPVQTDLFG